MTTTETVQLLGVSRPTALTYLHRLETAGLVEAVRMSANDPRGYWRLRRSPGEPRSLATTLGS
ncbi:MAG: helix-turn-helix domain-containing protein [Chloroflexota bacterium]